MSSEEKGRVSLLYLSRGQGQAMPKCKGVTSGDLLCTGPPLPIHICPNILFRKSRTSYERRHLQSYEDP
ncbi:hypothetical protein J6590_045030 [Homalodisca vitripennis]|nr:hypothetical protein J6590_045030 [Homalodisca vitripennis]